MPRHRPVFAALVVCCSVIFSAAIVTAQTTDRSGIEGRVIDTSGAALPGVTVTLTKGTTERVVITDANGKFAFPNVNPSVPYTLRAELAGFKTVIKTIEPSEDLHVTLKPSVAESCCFCPMPLIELDRVSVTTLTPFALSKLPF